MFLPPNWFFLLLPDARELQLLPVVGGDYAPSPPPSHFSPSRELRVGCKGCHERGFAASSRALAFSPRKVFRQAPLRGRRAPSPRHLLVLPVGVCDRIGGQPFYVSVVVHEQRHSVPLSSFVGRFTKAIPSLFSATMMPQGRALRIPHMRHLSDHLLELLIALVSAVGPPSVSLGSVRMRRGSRHPRYCTKQPISPRSNTTAQRCRTPSRRSSQNFPSTHSGE
jgi:hypothetical protein